MLGFDSFDRLPNLRVPTLVVHGAEDQAIAPENGELLAERIPGAELVLIEGAGHLYHSEQAGRADAAVLDFIRRHDDA
jgi:pimeloyl-ACP methyl ester carboxylesterase